MTREMRKAKAQQEGKKPPIVMRVRVTRKGNLEFCCRLASSIQNLLPSTRNRAMTRHSHLLSSRRNDHSIII
jgi:hypothetical protein